MLPSESTLSVFLSIRKSLSVQVQQMEAGYAYVILWLAIIPAAEFSAWHLARDSSPVGIKQQNCVITSQD